MSNNIMQMGFQRNEERPPPLSTSTILSPLARVSAVNNIIFDDIATPSAKTLLEIEHLIYIRRNVLTNHSTEDQEKHYQGNNEIYCFVLASAITYKIFFIGSWITFPPFRVVNFNTTPMLFALKTSLG